ncbi:MULTISPECIES: three component ABC system middle component [unclassified Pseudomonas]|uniref:three component ABC system middle component n=1 Tax=unclassified Pseudomonas TaxID=196821 RepID=UPI000D360D39|nr:MULTISPECIES: three component ABC system middle component [unclassified Pseudomonas]RAU45534.1 hypothetical protein DBP26_014015 [Pseudomonas sp. RIT 409]RAU53083.1 hypothetical protein DBY65_015730 [Pseudomonas sp. RIT 412]
MSEPYLDRQLIHNSSLACFLLAHFIEQYQDAASGQPPDLPKLMLVLPLTWSERSREALSKRNSRSTIANVMREAPVLKIDLAQRVTGHMPTTLQGLNLAVSSRLVGKIGSGDVASFQSLADRWPRGIRNTIPTAMLKTVEKLAKWFAAESTENLYKLLFGIPNEIHN